jgi:hypothetical protein
MDTTTADAGCTNATDNTQSAHGTTSKKLIVAAGTSLRAFDSWTTSLGTGITAGPLYLRAYVRLSATTTTEATVFWVWGNNTDWAFRVAVSAAGKIVIYDDGDNLKQTGTTTLAANTWYRVECSCSSLGTNATVAVTLYATIDSTGAPTETITNSTVNTGIGTSTYIGLVKYGYARAITLGAPSPTLWIDDIGVSTTGLLGPASLAISGTGETGTATDINTGIILGTRTDTGSESDSSGGGIGIPVLDTAGGVEGSTSISGAITGTVEVGTGSEMSTVGTPVMVTDLFTLSEVSQVTKNSTPTSGITEGPLTICSLLDEILDVVHGYIRGQEARTHLLASMTSTDTTFTAADPKKMSGGLIEIDEELVYVASVNPTNGLVTIEPWGRAQSQTMKVAHEANAKVVNNPVFPRQRVRNALWGVLREIFPDLFAFGEVFLNINPALTHYDMPTDAYHIMQVQWLLPGPTHMWAEANRWKQNKRAGGVVELELFSRVWPGQARARVQYMKVPPDQFGECDDLGTYGYDLQLRDLLVIGSAARLMAYVESSRVLTESVVSHGRSEAVPAGSATQISKYLYSIFQKRVADERTQQLLRHPFQIHITR